MDWASKFHLYQEFVLINNNNIMRYNKLACENE